MNLQGMVDAVKRSDRIMGIIIVLIVLAVLGSAIGMYMSGTEGFSPIDQWPYLPPKHWRQRTVKHWDPWYYRNSNHIYPANPSITHYSVQDYQFPARTLEMERGEMPMEQQLAQEAETGTVPEALPTDGLSQEMAEEGNAESQGLGPTPAEALPEIPAEGDAEEREAYGGGYGGARYRGARYEGYGGGYGGARYRGARYEGMGMNMSTRHWVSLALVVLLVGALLYRQYNKTEELPQLFSA
jgi:hypothetical protein